VIAEVGGMRPTKSPQIGPELEGALRVLAQALDGLTRTVTCYALSEGRIGMSTPKKKTAAAGNKKKPPAKKK